ncbi:MAG: EAL domain-containing protein [Algiphilus sp.]
MAADTPLTASASPEHTADTAASEATLRYRDVFNAAFSFMAVLHRDGWVLSVNDIALRFAERPREDAIGRPIWETPWFAHDEAAQQRLQAAVEQAARGEMARYEECIAGANSAHADVDLSIKAATAPGHPSSLLVLEARDTTQMKLIQTALRDSEERFRTSFDEAPIGKALLDLDGSFIRVNRALCDILGFGETELEHTHWASLTHPDDIDADMGVITDTLAGQRPGYRIFKRCFHQSGRLVHVQLDVALVRDQEGEPLYFIAQVQDISKRKKYEDWLFEANEMAHITLAAIGDGVIRTDARGTITYANDAACWHLARSQKRLIGHRFSDCVTLFNPGRDMPLPDPVDALLRMGVTVEHEPFPRLRNGDGDFNAIAYTLTPMYARDGEVLGCVFVFQDISDAKRAAEGWAFQASHDPMTGLLNRRAFEAALTELCARVGDTRRDMPVQHTLIYFDLDHFKVVNDTCGHQAGDKLLIEMGRLLRTRLRSGDRLARIGGDEFAVLLPECGLDDAQRIAQSLLEAAADYSFVADGRRFRVTLSLGVAPVTGSATETLARADTACYVAKRAGRNRVHTFSVTDADVSRARQELDWAQQLQAALDSDSFELHQQAIVQLDSGDVVGHEILLRFRGEDGRLIAPGAFMPAAQRLGLMRLIDLRVLRDVVAAIQEDAVGEGFVSVNLSAQSVGDPIFTRECLAVLDAAAIPAGRIQFEVNDGELALGSDATPLIDGLRQRGHAIWLDNFGTGFNSFDSLSRLKPDGIKIARATVQRLEDDIAYRHLVEAACRVMEDMGGMVIAEGLENGEMQRAVAAHGIVWGQGFHLGVVAEVAAQAA